MGQHRTKQPRDPAITSALKYERATLDALRILDGADVEAKRKACLLWGVAYSAINSLSNQDLDRAAAHLLQRGRISEADCMRVLDALDGFVPGLKANAMDMIRGTGAGASKPH
jgi:hypothetical protein